MDQRRSGLGRRDRDDVFVPAGWVGGDFYDFVPPAAGVALAILGDVSGKGIPAALIQSSLKALFRLIVRDTTDPAAIAERLAAELHEQTAGMPYATAIVARFESALTDLRT
jgi:sigma-B regulation protein RsbU (phosphoserine phosphatase)